MWKKSVALTAIFDIDTKSRSRHSAIPGFSVGNSVLNSKIQREGLVLRPLSEELLSQVVADQFLEL